MKGVQIENVNKIKYLGILIIHRRSWELQSRAMCVCSNAKPTALLRALGSAQDG